MFTRIQLVGTLTQDFEIKQGQKGNFLVSSLAVNGAYDNTTKVMDYQSEPEFFNLVIFYDSLIKKAKYFKKGFIVNVIGNLSRDKYLSTNGETRYRWKITVEEINPQVQGEELAQAISQAILDFKGKRLAQAQNGFNQTQNGFNQSQSSGFIQPTKSNFGQGQTNGFGQGNSFGQSNSFGYNNTNNGFGHNPNSFSNPNSSFNQTASQPNNFIKPTDNPNGFANTQNGFNQSQSANNQNGFNQQQEDQNPLSYNQFKQPTKQDNSQVEADIIKSDGIPF